jgi:AcrR family transcriptional regulator
VRDELRDVRARYILDVAQELLIERGYREASMDEIAARVGIAKGTLYQHFPSKDDLVRALVEHHLARFAEAVEDAAHRDEPARTRLTRVLRYVYEDPNGAYAMLRLLTHNAEIWRFVSAHKALDDMRRTSALLTGVLEAGRADGSLNPEIPTGVMLSVFFNALTLGRPEPRLGLEGMPSDELAGLIGRVLFDGIAGGRSTEG